jgi:serine protease
MRQTQIRVRAVCVGLAILFGVAAQAAAQNARYIVKFNSGRSAAGQAALRAAGGQVELVLDPQDAVAARIPSAALNGLSRNPNVEYIEEDVIREPYGAGQALPYGISLVQADKVSTNAASSQKICIIDSGYSQQHVDLKDAVTGEVTFTQTSSTWDKDSCGHGSHVAGTISAIDNDLGVVGVIPGVRLHIVKVFGDDNLAGGSCSWTYSSNLVAALNACTSASVHANIVSMSLGGTLKSRTEDKAFASAYNAGVLSIAAAGNGGNTRISYPAGYSSVVSVAAVDVNSTVASFSQRNSDVELAAPGVSVLSTVPWKETDTLTTDGATSEGGHIDGAARTSDSGVTGFLANDGGQCTAAGSWTGKVVLCQRGTNTFADKVKNVKAGGGVAAVIYNNVASDSSCGVFSGTLNGTSTIPATTLSCADGATAVGLPPGANGTVISQLAVPSSSYEAWDGTSMATPHVSGVAALVWSCNPGLTNAQVRSALDSSAAELGAAGRDTSYGYGLVQAKAAVLRLGTNGLPANIYCTVQ